ncbi:uncharacterized protein MELLADRAFT_104263 [Melampsora larici-populina 98AG31]|uniref:Uncharacterized protein n=1 Tax=Melampsora larici-populina (strain 98AG31 / pathotype 3-4-7) TaxID=747676 RepID=F4RE52_MELLP|nr:uncharacterized protein MELLADRAFT_104263 [Melampsora larici-populina 98AG31]EGG09330.1 hypothetical protein MELLADRAFT_104263 [Melampsora larici-populina 98AG31]
MTLGGSYDMAGVWRPDLGSGTATVYFDKLNPYNQSLYSNYYGSYGDLLEYEHALRLARDLSEDERLSRWQQRLAFEELEHEQRMRRYERMSEIERQRLGLVGRSWWAGRYGVGHHRNGGWRERFGDRLTTWTSDRLPLSSTLGHRYGSMRGLNDSLRRANHRVEESLYRAQDEIDKAFYVAQEDELFDAMRRQDRERERGREVEEELYDMVEEQRLERMREEDRLERQAYEARYIEERLDDQILENRVLEDRLYDDEDRLYNASDSRYREAELDCYEREHLVKSSITSGLNAQS